FNAERHCSLFMTLEAVLKMLLYRYSGKTDIIIGTPVAGRDHPDLEGQVGNYVNMLALRDSLDPDLSFARFLEQVKESAAEGFSHQMYPFDKLVEELRLPRDTSRSPLFDIVLVLQNFDLDPTRYFTSAEPCQVPMDISKYDITFNFNDKGKELDLLIEYNTRLFRKERILLIASHLKVLLEELIADPSSLTGKVKILDSAEEKDLLAGYNDTAAAYPDKETIITLFEKSAREHAGRTALVYRGKNLTYNQLNTRADTLSRFIRGNYIPEAGEVTGVFLSPSENTVIALLAILKAGGAYLPLDPEYPDERISHILSESRIKIALTTGILKERLQRIANEAGCDCLVLDIENAEEASADIPSAYPTPEIRPDTTAYVIFTSGSTGKPKGCQVSHRNLVRLFFNDRNHFDFSSEDVWIMAHSFCFDFSVWEMYGALLYGGRLIIPDRNDVRDISAFARIVSGQKVTVLNQTPGAFYKFSEYVTGSREKISLNLRYVIFGGDKLDPSKLREWIKIHPASGISLVNMYGITETTIHVTYHKLTDQEINSSTGSSNIGKPLPETKVYVLDEHRMLVPKGIYGEIYVGGSGVCKGYLNRPELTGERFIQNPYNDKEILYKSGDIGRWLCDGSLEYLDRSDNQVQIRGFRVEMAEIEMRLRGMYGITDVAVIAVDREGTKELAAYLVSEKEQKVNELKGFLSASLPEYMIPAYFIRTDKIPLTANGKLDKKNLPPAIQNIATGAEFENPENEVESVLLKIWQTVLSTENISVRDNFFDIGGNSILLVRLHSRINEIYPGILEITDLFSESTITEQAHFIASKINPDKKEISSGSEVKTRERRSGGIAIIGMALRIGSSRTPGEFWKELCEGRDLIGGLPDGRKRDIEELAALYDNYQGTLKYRQYCYLDEVDKFDYGFFRLSPSEAALIDPGQRLFLETACHAIEDAGYGGDKLWGSRTGIYIGASDNLSEYNRFIDSSSETDQNLLLTAQTPSILASRLAYILNLKGPAMLVDTACSSSLVALHLACQAIREGKIDTALVGGVKLHLLPLDNGSRSGIDSSDSRAHCFDDSADGTGGGEGVIAIVIKPLEKALEENDNIYAVIRGSEVNQDGSTIGITAPDADAQADVIDKAWKDAGIDPLTVSFIETHGTATKLGDPVEIEGISRAFRKYTAEKNFCAIGAIKANIGHLDTAAGLAGVVKAALSLSYRKLAPLVHFTTPNRNIKFEDSPVYINKELTDWISKGSPLRCGVSSFGLSGTNCHVVMEEAPQRSHGVKKEATGSNLFVLSARSEQLLKGYLAKISETIRERLDIDSHNLCYTLATGRGHHSCRAALIFDTIEELALKLDRREIPVKCVKTATPAKANLQPDEMDDPVKIAAAYLNGAEILWEEYYAVRYSQDIFPSKISLPGYPFEKNRCWVKLRIREQVKKFSPYARNYSNLFLNECIAQTPTLSLYKLNIQDNSWLLDEHRLMGIPTLVGTTYLQIAYEAGEIHFNTEALQIDELCLLKPLVLSYPSQEVILSVNKNPDGSINAEVQSREGENIWHTYARFSVSPAGKNEYQNPDIERVIKNSSLHKVITPESRKTDKNDPVQTSDKWNISGDIYWNDNESVARFEIPSADSLIAGKYRLYPPLTDAALSYALDEPGYVPFSFGTVRIISKVPDSIYSYVKKLPGESDGTRRYDIDITDASGNTVAQFRGFTFKRAVIKGEQKFYELGWRAFQPQFPELPGSVNAVLIYNSKCNPLLVGQIRQMPGIKEYCIDDGNYSVILNQEGKKFPDKVLYVLPGQDFSIVRNSTDTESALEDSLYSAYNFAAYLSSELSSGMDLLFLGENVLEVTGREKRGNPFGYAVAGLSQVLGREIPYLSCRFLDVDGNCTAGQILNELLNGFKESFHYRAYREGTRYLREMNILDPAKKEDSGVEIKEGGAYLITGGTGGIGLELARWISSQKKVKLVLAGRSLFPSEDKWGDILTEGRDARLCSKIKIIKEIINSGSEVILSLCDVADYPALEELTKDIIKKHGKICGVIHTAGIAGEGFIHSKKPGEFKKVLIPKIHGTVNLVNLFRKNPPDFFVMTSALTALIPTAGQSDYTSANCFLDAVAREPGRKGIRAQSINFSAWKETGMAYEKGVLEEGVFSPVSVQEGVSAFSTVLHKKVTSVIPGRVNLSFLDKSAGLPFLISDNILQNGSEKVEAKKDQPSEAVRDQIPLTGRDSGEYSETEIAVAQIWGEVLGYDTVGVGENYYDLGGDSIHAIKIIQLIGNRIKIKLSVGDLLNHLTIEELAVFLESKLPSSPDSKQPSSGKTKLLVSRNSGKEDVVKGKDEQGVGFEIPPAPVYDFYPVSAAQRRLFILDRLTNDRLGYHIPEIWQIKGNLDISRLTSAFEKLVKRHEILRTSFDLVNDLPVQIIGEYSGFEIPLKKMEEEEARTYILSFIEPFDLAKAPLFRVEIIEIASGNHLLLFDAHHIIVDAFSMEILKKEVFGYYNGIEQEPLRIQYKDYAVWQNGFVQRYETEKKKSYWIDEFKEDIPVLNLPLDYPRSSAN
ncbi:MAG: amino acid adenylation domain-containing protein, partial [Bacteroidales bacterium]|nr:amino acid adenylation domain-containing protein [Bacteroidales bacterium]